MDRFVLREPRLTTEQQQGNPMVSVSIPSANTNNMVCHESNYFQGSYASEFPSMLRNPSFSAVPHMAPFRNDMMPGQMQPAVASNLSGIDPNYLASYGHNATFIATGQPIERPTVIQMNQPFGSEYQNRGFVGAERNSTKQFVQHTATEKQAKNKYRNVKSLPGQASVQRSKELDYQTNSMHVRPKINEVNQQKSEVHNDMVIPLMSRSEKLKVLQKSGPRSFSGPVEKVLKWHKALQDIGILVIYEIVGKCVSIRPGDSCAKNLVVRDDSGPAMQVVYYEVDFLLPELKPPCTVRVVGRMLAGTNRLQAFNVRPASGDDVTTLSRRAAVATHHVAKLCKEFGIDK